MSNREQECQQKIELMQREINKLSVIVIGLIEQCSQDGRTAIIKAKRGQIALPQIPSIRNEVDESGNWRVQLDYGSD